jgi:hypothetical protein
LTLVVPASSARMTFRKVGSFSNDLEELLGRVSCLRLNNYDSA